MTRTDAFRRRYAELVTARDPAARDDERLVRAFETVRREDFLGPGPWQVLSGLRRVTVPSSRPELLYRDALVALDSERRLNNGQPSLHAAAIAALGVAAGDTVVHVGAGAGYYTAILAELSTPSGEVRAYELDASLAKAAASNLARYPNIDVRHASGVDPALPACDALYVSAGATHPVRRWLEALRPGGRLVFPLTSVHDAGGMLRLRRVDATTYTARFGSRVRFVPCAGARDEETGRRLERAFAGGGADRVRSLRTGEPPDESCWVRGEGWWLSTRSVGGRGEG